MVLDGFGAAKVAKFPRYRDLCLGFSHRLRHGSLARHLADGRHRNDGCAMGRGVFAAQKCFTLGLVPWPHGLVRVETPRENHTISR